MTYSARALLLAMLVLGLMAAPTLVAGATEETPTVTDEAPAVDAPEPAIAVPEEAPDDDTAEWSYRFLVPATLVLGTLAVVGTIIMYFIRVTKARYRVVE